MKSQSLIYLKHERGRDLADLLARALDCYRPDLLRLSLRILAKASSLRRKQHLEGIHALDV